MANGQNGQHLSDHGSTRRVRLDDMAAIVLRNSPGPAMGAHGEPLPAGHSGKLLIVAAGITLLLLWGTLFLVFRDWRAHYRERALYGSTQITPAIDRFRSILPPGVDPRQWRDAVDQTQAMLRTVTGSNLLDIAAMDALRAELEQHASRAAEQPETAIGELGKIWDEISEKGEFLFSDSRSLSGVRHPRPNLLPRPVLAPKKTSPRRGEWR